MLGIFANGPLTTLAQSLSKSRRRQLCLLCVLMVVSALAEFATIAAVVPFLALLAGTSSNAFWLHFGFPHEPLLAGALIFAATAIFAGAIRIAFTWVTQSFSFGFGHDLALAIQTRLLYQPYAFHTSSNSGDLVAAHEKIFAFIHGAVLPTLNGIAGAIAAFFIIAILTYIDPLAAGFAVVAIAMLYVGITWLSREPLRRCGVDLNASHSERVRAVQESLGGIRDVILDQSQPAHLSHFAGITQRYSRAEMTAAFLSATPRYAIETLGMVFIAAFALVLSRGESFATTLPVLGAMALSAQRLLPLLQQAYQGWAQLRTGSAHAAELATLLRLDEPRPQGAEQIKSLPLAKCIRFDGVRFRYPGGRGFVVDSVDFTVPVGARIALVGRTGSGKSTLLDILMGLIDPTEGKLTIDGAILAGDRRRSWQSEIAHVPQSVFLADASIAKNIAFGHADADVDFERVRWATRLAQAEAFIEAMPARYDTRVGERGIQLSGGQRQRVGIARALYKRASVLVLDEATSALDSETEAKVMNGIAGLKGHTLIMVAHRQSTLAVCDRIVRLENGSLSELGSFAEFTRLEERGPLVRTAS